MIERSSKKRTVHSIERRGNWFEKQDQKNHKEAKTMACLLVPAAEAVVTTIIKKRADKTADWAKTEVKNRL